MSDLTKEQNDARLAKCSAWVAGEITAWEYHYWCLTELGILVFPCESMTVEKVD